MDTITIKIQYSKNGDLETFARLEEAFAVQMEEGGCIVEFMDEFGTLPRPRRPKKE